MERYALSLYAPVIHSNLLGHYLLNNGFSSGNYLKFMQASGHYHYDIICQLIKFDSWT